MDLRRVHVEPGTRLLLQSVLYVLPVAVALGTSVSEITLPGFLLLLALTGAVALVGNYVLVYSPAVSFRNRQLTSFLNHHLELLVEDYRRRNDIDCNIRANIMVPQHRRVLSYRGGLDFRFEREEFLKIAYHSGEYEQIEVNREWDFGQGCCGKAYANNDQVEAQRQTGDARWG